MKKSCQKKSWPELLRKCVLLMIFVLSVTSLAAQPMTVSGKISFPDGRPAVGATVIIQGSSLGTIAASDGSYSITVPGPESVMEFSMMGYKKVTETVGTKTSLNVTFEDDVMELDAVVFVGYGTVRKKDLTGAVTVVNATELQKEQPATVQDMLRAGVAGLSVGFSTDSKGNASMLIRGDNSLRDSNAPLLVLDGVIYDGQLTDINPSDIEDITILKDGSSAAIYGSKAANGVVAVTTKRGKEGKPVITLSSTTGLNFKNDLHSPYKGEDYVWYRRDRAKYANLTAPDNYYDHPSTITSNDELLTWLDGSALSPLETWLGRIGLNDTEQKNYLAGNVVDWEKLVYRDVSVNQDYTLSASGKAGKTSYYTSLNYLKNQNLVRGGGYSAVRARLNLDTYANDYITYGIHAQFSMRDEGYVSLSSGAEFQRASPYGDIYNEDGTLKMLPHDNTMAYNPLLNANYIDRKAVTHNLTTSAYFKVQLPFGFSLQTTYSPNLHWYDYYNHNSEENPRWSGADKSAGITRRHQRHFFWQLDNVLKWNKTFGKHEFDFTGLVNAERKRNWNTDVFGWNVEPNDILGWHGLHFAVDLQAATDNNQDSERTANAFLARMTYNYDNRYFVTLFHRTDGDSAFGNDNPYAHFKGGALAWTFTEEAFFPQNRWFNYGKIRISYGENGNRDIGTYAALMRLTPLQYIYGDYTSGSENTLNTYFSSSMGNRKLKWETTKSWNLGLDFGMFDNRLTGTLEFYKKATQDLLISRMLIDITGFTSVTSNIGEVRNKGVELTLNSRNIQRKNWSWNTAFTMAYNKNRIVDLYGDKTDDITNGWFIGKSRYQVWGYKVIGVWQEDEAEQAAFYGQRPGDHKIWKKDWDDDKYSDEDKVFLGETSPKYRLSMRNNFTFFQNITFSLSVYSYLGHYRSYGDAINTGGAAEFNSPVKKYWTTENPSNTYSRLNAIAPSGVSYSVYKKANFIRFDNISLGYRFPRKLLEKALISDLHLNVTLKNAGYFTSYPARDPQTSNMSPRILYFGVNLTF